MSDPLARGARILQGALRFARRTTNGRPVAREQKATNEPVARDLHARGLASVAGFAQR